MIDVLGLVTGLRRLADKDRQRRTWFSVSGPEVSSFTEDVCSALDDPNVGHAIDVNHCPSELTQEEFDVLKDLDAAITVAPKGMTPDELLDDPRVEDVRAFARAALELLERRTFRPRAGRGQVTGALGAGLAEMEFSITVAPANSLVLIMDPAGGDIPRAMAGELVSATPECVAVGTRAEADGDTHLMLSNVELERPSGMALVFDGAVWTHSRAVAVRSVLGEVLLTVPVANAETRVRVWANHVSEPDELFVVAQPAGQRGTAE